MLNAISREKSFYRGVAALAWPVIAQNLLNNGLALLDSFMVGSLGERYLSAISLANTVFTMTNLALFGLQSGSTVLIAQYHGKKDETSINRVMGLGFALSFTISMIIALVVFLFPMQLYSLTTNDMELAAIAADYGRIAAFSIVFNALSVIYLSAQRSMENPRLGMKVLGVSMSLKTCFNAIFVLGVLGTPILGIKGAALATLLSRIIEFTITFIYALRNKRFRLQFEALIKPGKDIFMDYLKYSLPVIINESLWGFGASMNTVIFGHLPNAMEALAAFSIVANIERIISAILNGLSHTAGILVGKALGAGRKDEAYQTGMTMLYLTGSIGVAAAVLMALLSPGVLLPYLFPLFGASASTLAIGMPFLLIGAASVPFRAINFCGLVGLTRGGGDVRAGMLIDLSSLYGVGLPLSALAAFVFKAPAYVVFMTVNMDEMVKSFFVLWRLSKKKWLQNLTR